MSPMMRMLSAVGPMNVMPHFSQTSAKTGFSERKPYPGWIASASVSSAAEMMAFMFR